MRAGSSEMRSASRSVTIHRRLRPLRLAHLVRPADPDALLRAVEANTCVWGGVYNAIVPTYANRPRWWGPRGAKALSAREIVKGYLQALEPEYVVASNREIASGLGIDDSRLLSLNQILPKDSESHVGHGVSVVELYTHLHNRSFQFVRRNPDKVIVPTIADPRFRLFSAVCFGAFPTATKLNHFGRAYMELLDAKEEPVASETFFATYTGVGLPVFAGSLELGMRRTPWSLGPTLFFMDAMRPIDLIDFWNLRATGRSVIPIPMQWGEEVASQCRSFIASNHTPEPRNPHIMRMTTLMKARSVNSQAFEGFVDQVRGNRDALVRQDWYPCLWDGRGSGADDAARCELVAAEGDVDADIDDDHITFSCLAPEFLDEHWRSSSPGWANVVQIRQYQPGTEAANVIPSGLGNIADVVGAFPFDQLSVCSEGIVVMCDHVRDKCRWRVPDGLRVFRAWAAERGYEAELSPAGRIVTQLIRSLDGTWGVGLIAEKDILHLLDRMAHGLVETAIDASGGGIRRLTRRFVKRKTWIDLLKQLSGNDTERAVQKLKALTQRGVLRVGIAVECPHCQHKNWYPVGRLAEALDCERCLSDFPFPSAVPPDHPWSYRTQGAFSIGHHAQGGYSVALALRRLTSFGIGETTWVPSVILRGPRLSEIEVDFALWWKGSFLDDAVPTLVVGECKSFNRADDDDLKRMANLAQAFPEAIVAFATLQPDLSALEKHGLAELVAAHRSNLPFSETPAPFLVLTGHELLSTEPLPLCWEGKSTSHDAVAEAYRRQDGLPALCDASHQLYLGMHPHHEWLRAQMQLLPRSMAKAKGATVSAEARTSRDHHGT